MPAPLPALDSSGRRPVAGLALLPLLALVFGVVGGGPQVVAEGGSPIAAAVVPGRTFAWLKELQTRYPHRSPQRKNHGPAIAFVASSFRAAGLEQVEQVPLGRKVQGEPLVNVVARVPGRQPAEHVIVFCAHLDSVPKAPGAVDNGSGVAVLIELARVLQVARPACDVLLVAVDGEELGLLGSKAYVESLGEAGRARVQAAVSVDMVGWRQEQLMVEALPHGFAHTAAGAPPAWLPVAVRQAGWEADLPVEIAEPWRQAVQRAVRLWTGSDDGAFLERGIPAVMLSGQADGLVYSGYHNEDDVLRHVDSGRLDEAARVAAAAAIQLSAPRPEGRGAVGDPYLIVGELVWGRAILTLLGLTALLPLLLSWWGVRSQGRGPWWLLGAALSLAGLVALCFPLGLLVAAPAALALALMPCLPGRTLRLLVAGLGCASPIRAGRIVREHAGTFGFEWMAPVVPTALTLAFLVCASCGAVWLMRTRREEEPA